MFLMGISSQMSVLRAWGVVGSLQLSPRVAGPNPVFFRFASKEGKGRRKKVKSSKSSLPHEKADKTDSENFVMGLSVCQALEDAKTPSPLGTPNSGPEIPQSLK